MAAGAMTTIQYYQLLSSPLTQTVPKLVGSALAAGHRAVIAGDTDAQLRGLSDALWSQDPASFLPHGLAADGQAAAQPVYLTCDCDENPNGADIFLALAGRRPGNFSRYVKLLDLFDGNDEAALDAARARYRADREAGRSLQFFRQQPGGGWAREGGAQET